MSYAGTRINPKRFDRSQLKFYAFLVPFALLMALPIVYIFNQALKPVSELFAFPPRFFVIDPTLDNFSSLFRVTQATGIPMSRYLYNSVVVTLASVVLSIAFSVSAGYVMSKKPTKWVRRMFSLNQTALMFVPIAATIPRYILVVRTGIYDTFGAHILPMLAMPVGLFLIKQFIDQIPDPLLDAARVDGANDFRIVWSLVMPMVAPAIATVGILTFQAVWNSTEASGYYIENEALRTATYYLSNLTTTTGNTVAGTGIAAAASLLLFLPNLIIFIFLQSKVMSTMAHSGIK